MRAITIWQPYASLIVLGLKRFETRSWTTTYRGPLIIQAAKKWDCDRSADYGRVLELIAEHGFPQSTDEDSPSNLAMRETLGCVLGVVDLTDCQPMLDGGSVFENEVGFFGEGRFGWTCSNPVAFRKPIPVVGKQGLWVPSPELVVDVEHLAKIEAAKQMTAIGTYQCH